MKLDFHSNELNVVSTGQIHNKLKIIQEFDIKTQISQMISYFLFLEMECWQLILRR